MKNLSENPENLGQLREKYSKLLREFNRLKDENKRLKERFELGDFDSSPNSTPELKLEKNSPDAVTIDLKSACPKNTRILYHPN